MFFRMSSIAVTALWCGGAFAQSPGQDKPVEVTRTVPAGQKRQVGFYASQNPDCSLGGPLDMKVQKTALNGTVEIEKGMDFPYYPSSSQRYACNLKQVEGMKVFYTAKDNFSGVDAFTVETVTARGRDVTRNFNITVK